MGASFPSTKSPACTTDKQVQRLLRTANRLILMACENLYQGCKD